jgi:hypothetical protein
LRPVSIALFFSAVISPFRVLAAGANWRARPPFQL